MICPRCNSQVADGVKFCGVCGSPMPQQSSQPHPSNPYGGMPGVPPQQPSGPYGTPSQPSGSGAYGGGGGTVAPDGGYIPQNQYEEYTNSPFGNAVPKAELHNPKGPLHVGDMTISIEGELVPVVDIMLGNQLPIYFEHHILLWKHPGVQIGFKSLQGMAKRFFAGLQIFITEAQGPGNISFSRDSVGQIVALRLQPGQMVEVREHQFLVATGNVDYNFTFVQGAANILFSRTGLFIDQFTAQGSEGMVLLHGYGNVFEKMLAPGEALDVEPGAWLWKDPSVQMSVTTPFNSQRRGGGIFGAIGGFMAGSSIILNRFIGPGRVGIQSMSYHPPSTEGTPQAGGSSNIGALGQFFNS
ncbi:MAG: AIM24 family protein [Chloroflexota bacterium]|nr:AIM24 family protein [Chloroflexota bacterium]